MKVRMKTVSAGPSGVLRVGDVLDVPESEAELLINGNYAEAIDKRQKTNKAAEEEQKDSGTEDKKTEGGEGEATKPSEPPKTPAKPKPPRKKAPAKAQKGATQK